jgi:hypothetical protein
LPGEKLPACTQRKYPRYTELQQRAAGPLSFGAYRSGLLDRQVGFFGFGLGY